jgi:hypothetical protein
MGRFTTVPCDNARSPAQSSEDFVADGAPDRLRASAQDELDRALGQAGEHHVAYAFVEPDG